MTGLGQGCRTSNTNPYSPERFGRPAGGPVAGGIEYMAALSLRRLWTIYKKILVDDGGMSKRDLILAQHSF